MQKALRNQRRSRHRQEALFYLRRNKPRLQPRRRETKTTNRNLRSPTLPSGKSRRGKCGPASKIGTHRDFAEKLSKRQIRGNGRIGRQAQVDGGYAVERPG